MHIWSDQWETRKDIIKDMIRAKLGLLKIKLNARSLYISEVSPAEKNKFMNDNHIQGECRSSIKYGLYDKDNTLVSCMTFTKKDNKTWELVRYAVKNNHVVRGGFSKLLIHFTRNYSGDIISYSDRTYSNGSVYKKNGFRYIKSNKPGYWYVDSNYKMRMHRRKFQKKYLGLGHSDTRTEQEVMFERGYHKIYNCGTDVWLLET